jgi:hypothetical protein
MRFPATRLRPQSIRRATPVVMLGADARSAQNDEDGPAAIDASYGADKASGALQAREDHRALEQQAHQFRCWGVL